MITDERVVSHNALNRRTFLKASAAAIASSAVLGNSGVFTERAFAQEEDTGHAPDVVKPGTCRGCGAGCQMNVHARDGKIVKVSRRIQADPDLTRICNKGLTHALRVYEEGRLKYPMKRVGERGSGEWEQISWDEAITTITDKWKKVAEKYGPAANAFLKGSGNMSPDAHHTLRLRSAMGATLIDPAQDRVYYAAFPATVGYGSGGGGAGQGDYANAKHLILWGANPAEAASQTFHYMLRAKEQYGTKIITIDPNLTTTGSKADIWVPIQPGTDGALALSMINVLVNEGLANEDFLSARTVAPFLVKDSDGKYLRLSDLGKAEPGSLEDKPVVRATDGTVGLPEDVPEPVIKGSYTIDGCDVTTAYSLLIERANEWPPEKASELCDVPVERIKELAHMVVDGSCSFNIGLGLNQITNGYPTYISIISLIMVAGQFGNPGNSGTGFIRGAAAASWNPYALEVLPDAPPSNTFYAPALLNCLDSKKYGDTDINIKTLYVWNHNLFGTEVGGNKWREFLEGVELFAVADVIHNSTTSYADIVLPACHYFECESASGDSTPYVFYSAKSAEPLYESKSDFEMSQMFFERMGLQEFGFSTIEEVMAAVFDNPASKALNLSWDRVKEEKAVPTFEFDNRVFGQEGKFNTPTGRLQFYQEKIKTDGGNWGQELDFMKERLPYWEPPQEASMDNPLAKKYPLVFTSERSKFKGHTQFTRIPWFLELENEPYVCANPIEYERRGIADGDYIRLFNDRGHCTLRARYSNGIRPGMVVIDHGWDKDQFVDGFYCDLAGPLLHPVVANSYYFDVLVEMEKTTV